MNVGEIIDYIKKYEGMRYIRYDRNNPNMGENEPFWVSSDAPPIKEAYEKGSTCVGLINLVRRFIGLQIPGIKENYKIQRN